jgi:hypothetical protein
MDPERNLERSRNRPVAILAVNSFLGPAAQGILPVGSPLEGEATYNRQEAYATLGGVLGRTLAVSQSPTCLCRIDSPL